MESVLPEQLSWPRDDQPQVTRSRPSHQPHFGSIPSAGCGGFMQNLKPETKRTGRQEQESADGFLSARVGCGPGHSVLYCRGR